MSTIVIAHYINLGLVGHVLDVDCRSPVGTWTIPTLKEVWNGRK
jgi:hypothetical protein